MLSILVAVIWILRAVCAIPRKLRVKECVVNVDSDAEKITSIIVRIASADIRLVNKRAKTVAFLLSPAKSEKDVYAKVVLHRTKLMVQMYLSKKTLFTIASDDTQREAVLELRE